MYHHGRIAQHGLGPGRGHHDIFILLVFDRIFNPVKRARDITVFHFFIGKRGLAARAPVDDIMTAVNQPAFIETAEDLGHGSGVIIVHGESDAVPVAGAAQALKLLDNRVTVFFSPLPDALYEFIAAQFMARGAFFSQFLLDHVLGGNTSMVRTGHPGRFIPLHPLKTDDNILRGIIHDMAHMENPGNVRRRNYQGERLFLGVNLAGKVAFIQPELINTFLYPMRVVDRCKFHRYIYRRGRRE